MIKAIVTGHSRGLGAAIANQLLLRGIPLLAIARSPSPDLAARFPDLVQEVALDLTQPERIAHWLDGGVLPAFLRDCERALLINNAGMLQPVGRLEMQNPRRIADAVNLNVTAALMLAGAFADASTGVADRRILHVSSGAARSPYPGWSVYCAGKAALDHHARAVSLDATPGLRICSVAPGVIDTAMQADIRASSLEQFPLRDKFEAMQRSGGLAQPGPTAERLVRFMLDDAFGSAPTADLRDLPQ
ncbi:MAG TPA: SDR family oxidoreductase [Rhodocyclaceae bacterium]|nr:SDR family oxidoreductase [Zoogloeaceae bacterium]HRD34650.1 SDR family oxidoreductase [Rhodocyclaceae bacterium]